MPTRVGLYHTANFREEMNMAKGLKIVEHCYVPNLAALLALDRGELKTILICGLTATLWVRFLNQAFQTLLPHVNVQFVAVDRFPIDSEHVADAHATYGLPFRGCKWYAQFDLEKEFGEFEKAVKKGHLFIQGEWIKIDGVICTTTPDLNLAVLRLWLEQDVQVYLDKPLVKLDEFELKQVAELKRRYPHLIVAGDFFITSPVVDWAITHLQELVPGYQLTKILGACVEPWTLDGEKNKAGNREWMPDPNICLGIGGNDCGVHVLGAAHYFLTRLGHATSQTKAVGSPICGRYLCGGKTDFRVETAFFGQYDVGDVPVAFRAGKGLGGEPFYGLQLWFKSARVNLMVGTPRFDPHVAVDDGQSVTVHKIVGGGLGYAEIAAMILTRLYGGERMIRTQQAQIFAAMYAASVAIHQSYLNFDNCGQFADYPVGGRLPGVPPWAILRMPEGLKPDRDIAITF